MSKKIFILSMVTFGLLIFSLFVTVKTASACERRDPTASVSPSNQFGAPDNTRTYTATVTNNDTSGCSESTFSYSTFSTVTNCPSGWACSVSPTSGTLNPGSSQNISISITSASDASYGTYPFTFRARTGISRTERRAEANYTYSVNVRNYSTPGSYTYTIPAGVREIVVEMWGGGGAGGAVRSRSTAMNFGAAGGGGGAYAKSTLSVREGDTFIIVVGAGGIGGSDSGPRGEPSFIGPNNNPVNALVLAAAGQGGAYYSSSASGSPGGKGGSCQDSIYSDVCDPGKDGADGRHCEYSCSGSGGDAGGGGGKGGAYICSSGCYKGNPGEAPGGGGGGGFRSRHINVTCEDGAPGGGDGAPGKVLITEKAPVEYSLTITSGSGGSVVSPGDGTFSYYQGDVVYLEARADFGYQFVNWTGDTENIGNSGSANTSITMLNNYSIRANFEQKKYDLWIESGEGGSVTAEINEAETEIPSGEYVRIRNIPHGTVVDLNAFPEVNYSFDHWFGGTDTIGDINSAVTTITMEDSYYIGVYFIYQGDPPTVPIGLTCNTISSSRIDLSWNAASGATDYRVYRCTGSGCTPVPPHVQQQADTAWANTGLTENRTYGYSVTAYNGAGESDHSNMVECTTLEEETPPPVPMGFTCSTISSSRIDLSWDAASGATGYRVYRCAGSGCTPVSPYVQQQAGTAWANTIGLDAYTTYGYNVTAYNGAGESDHSNIVECTTRLATPTGFTCTIISSSQINLSWNAVSGATFYRIFRCEGSGCTPVPPHVQQQADTAWANTGLTENRTYGYSVRAYAPDGVYSNYSITRHCTTDPEVSFPPTVDLKVNGSDGPITIVYNTPATLSWTSTDATSCTASGDWSGNRATDALSESTGNLTSTSTYELTCTGPGGSASDSVTVYVSTDTPPTAAMDCNIGNCIGPGCMCGISPWQTFSSGDVIFYIDNQSTDGTNLINQSVWSISGTPHITCIVPDPPLCNMGAMPWIAVEPDDSISRIIGLEVRDGVFSPATTSNEIIIKRDAKANFQCSFSDTGPWEDCTDSSFQVEQGQIIYFRGEDGIALSRPSWWFPGPSVINTWLWEKGDGTTFTEFASSSHIASTTLTSSTGTIRLTVTDNHPADACHPPTTPACQPAGRTAQEKYTLNVRLPLPEYREVRPRSQLDSLLVMIPDFFSGFLKLQ